MLASKRTRLILTGALAVSAMALACSPTTRYRVLSFFLDGVPEPTAQVRDSAAMLEEDADVSSPGKTPAPAEAKLVFHAHPPYRKNQCGACHDRRTGGMFRSLDEGLCLTCHRVLTAQRPYVHGPVAVNACTFCHHHHGSRYPNMLQTDPGTLCFRCHEHKDLSRGDHHAEIATALCFTCHDPHAADNRFFLKRLEP